MFQPLHLETEKLILHPFRAGDVPRYRELVTEIYHLLTDEETLQFIPEKRLFSLADAEAWLNGAIINLHAGRNSVHFITDQKTGALVGIVDIIPPAVAKEHYQLKQYPFFIEFYLKANAKGKAVMTRLLPQVIAALKSQGIDHVAAVVNRRNHAASKVLGKAGFVYRSAFDPVQDFYEWQRSA